MCWQKTGKTSEMTEQFCSVILATGLNSPNTGKDDDHQFSLFIQNILDAEDPHEHSRRDYARL
jgi:hypothetical protein